jgi:hypothetical protein
VKIIREEICEQETLLTWSRRMFTAYRSIESRYSNDVATQAKFDKQRRMQIVKKEVAGCAVGCQDLRGAVSTRDAAGRFNDSQTEDLVPCILYRLPNQVQ